MMKPTGTLLGTWRSDLQGRIQFTFTIPNKNQETPGARGKEREGRGVKLSGKRVQGYQRRIGKVSSNLPNALPRGCSVWQTGKEINKNQTVSLQAKGETSVQDGRCVGAEERA